MTQQFNVGDKVQYPIDDDQSTFEITDITYSDVIGTHTYKLDDGVNIMWVNEVSLRFYNTPTINNV